MKLILDVLRLKSQHGSEQERWIRTWKTLISLQNQKTHRPRSLRLGPGVCALLTPQVGLSMDPTGKVQSEARSQSAQSPKLEGYGALGSLWPGPCGVGAKGPGLLHTQLQARGFWLAWRSAPGFVSCDLKAVGSTLLFLVNNQKKKKSFRFENWRPSVSHSIFPLLWLSFILPSLSPTLRTHSSAGSIVTLFDYLCFNENVGFVFGIKRRAFLVPTQNRCLTLFT